MPARSDGAQFRPLVRIFVARFFENDVTASAHDLKRSFFGLLAILGVPGALVPFVIGFTWTIIGRYQGVAALRAFSRADKDFYLGFTMIASATIVALSWSTLLIDRRDAVVLGTLPVRPRTIVAAKLAALGVYVGAIALTMHALSSLSWGLFLDEGRGRSLAFLVRGIAAHFIAGTAASTFTVLVVMAVQGVVLAIGGPRLFGRLSSVFQVVLVVGIGVALITFPASAESVVHALAFPGDRANGWALSLPPAWFLGLYEYLLGGLGQDGGADLVLRHLAQTATLVTLGALAVALVSHVTAYRRVMRSAIEQEDRAATRLGSTVRRLSRVTTRRPALQGVVAFFLTSVTRVERQRLALGAGIGVAVAWAMPVLERMPTLVRAPTPEATLLTPPVALMVLWLAALRVSAALPSDLKASWIFDLQRPEPTEVRAVVERVFALVGVLPFVLVSSAGVWLLWGPTPAAVHAVFLTGIGLAVVESLITGIADAPGTQPWRPERAQLRSRWPFYLFGFLWLASGFRVPGVPGTEPELLLMGAPGATVAFVGLIAVLVVMLRRHSLERLRLDELTPRDDETFDGTSVTVRLN